MAIVVSTLIDDAEIDPSSLTATWRSASCIRGRVIARLLQMSWVRRRRCSGGWAWFTGWRSPRRANASTGSWAHPDYPGIFSQARRSSTRRLGAVARYSGRSSSRVTSIPLIRNLTRTWLRTLEGTRALQNAPGAGSPRLAGSRIAACSEF